MFTFIDILTLTAKLTARVTENQLVGFDGAPAGLDGPVLGYAKSDGNKGDDISIGVIGTREFIAGDAIMAGDQIISDASGKPIKAAPTAVNIIGRALNSASVGNAVNVLLK